MASQPADAATQASTLAGPGLLWRDLRPLPPLPGFRPRSAGLFGDATSTTVSVLQFNVLADSLATRDAFPLVPADVLVWSYRWPLILEEMTRHQPDIVCLEEVDHYHDQVAPAMEARGYQGVFLPKGRKPNVDGSAVFYLASRFRAVSIAELVYADRVPGSTHQVALILLLAPVSAAAPADPEQLPEGTFCVATTHLKAKVEFEALRLAQLGQVVRELLDLRSRYSRLPIIFTGDLNTEPTGPCYALLATGRSADTQTAPNFEVATLPLESAYSHYQPDWPAASLDGAAATGMGRGYSEPSYTTWKLRPPEEVHRVSDYIWYTNDTFAPEKLLEIPPPQALPPTKMPCATYPSDHFALQVTLRFAA